MIHNTLPQIRRHLTLDRVFALLMGLFALLLYWRTLAPGVISIADDTLEFQLIAQRGAIPHPTGYPLYAILLTLAARLLPIGEVAFRANLLSAVMASLAVMLTYLVARAMGMKRFPAIFSASLLAVTPTFWAQATIAEVYALHIALICLFILTTLRATASSEGATARVAPTLSAFVFGLGLVHHRTIVLWVPAVGIYLCGVWWQRGERGGRRGEVGLCLPPLPELGDAPAGWGGEGRQWGKWLLVMLMPLLLYAWLPLRADMGSIDGTYSEVGFVCWVQACQYQGFFEDNALAQARPFSFFVKLTIEELTLFAIILAIGGLVRLWAHSRVKWLFLISGLLTNALFAMLYRVPDPEVFWLPVIWVLALLAGWAVQALLEFAAAIERTKGYLQVVTSILLLAPFLLHLSAIFPELDRSQLSGPRDFNGRDVLAQPLPEQSVIIGLLGEATYLRYLQEAEGIQPDVATLDVPTDPASARFEAIEVALAAGQHPFLTRELPEAGTRWSLSQLGPLIEVRSTPQQEVPAGLWPLNLTLNQSVRLAAWNRSPIAGSSLERITVAWQVTAPITEPLQVSARLVAADGSFFCPHLCQQDSPPLNNAYPTTLWRLREVILDSYELPPAPPEAHYLFILYRPTDGSEVGRAEW